jgi:predicted N-acetyltransferase YhbS
MIIDLQQAPHLIPTLARWHHAEWSALNPGQSLEQRIARMSRYRTDEALPRMVVWLDGEQPLGTAALVQSDMDTRPQQSPWLAAVYVREDCRRRGIAEALISHVVAQAREAGHPELFLFTPSQAPYYARRGWQTLAVEDYRGQQVTVMRIALNAEQTA